MRIIIKLVVLSILFTSAFTQITDCKEYVQNLINEILDFKITSLPLPSILYSGIGITTNNPGQLAECQESNYSYYLVFLKDTTTNITTESFSGLCMPIQCKASDIEIALEFLHSRVYSEDELEITDTLAQIGSLILILWLFVLFICSCFHYMNQPIINEYLVNERSEGDEVSGSVELSNENSDNRGKGERMFYFYDGYKGLFKLSNKTNALSLVLFLAVVSFAVSVEFSYRQHLTQNSLEIFDILNSTWGIFICNIEISLHTIIFVLGFRLAQSMSAIKNFRSIGREIFDLLIKKWLILVLMSLLVYSILSYSISQPLCLLWKFNNGKECSMYIWQIWFLFRNLLLDSKICLPWFSLIEADLLFTILSSPLILIFKVNKKIGYFLIVLLIMTSLGISITIVKNEAIVFEPTKLLNSEKEYSINYQGNAFVRLGAFSLGLFFSLFISEGLGNKKSSKKGEAKIRSFFNKYQIFQWIFSVVGLGLMGWCYSLIVPYLDINSPLKQPYYYLILCPLGFVFGLGLFIISCCWEGEALLTKLITNTIGWHGWIHLDRISISFYCLAPMVIGYSTYSSQNSMSYDVLTVGTYLVGDLFFTYFCSIFVTAAIENQVMPLVSRLQTLILGKEAQYSAILIEEL